MSKPSTRQQLIDYSLRKLGAPVLEINLDDGHAVRFGNSNELQMFHGSNNVSKIEDSGAGFHIRQINNGDIHIHAGADTGSANNRIVARSAGAAELYHSGSKMLETTSTGIQMEGSINLRDDHKVQLGNNQDLQIYHSSNVNFIDSSTVLE